MLNIFPWKLLKPRTPINKPGRHWFNGVTRALATMGVRVGKADESPHIERPNTDGSNWNIVLPAAIFNTNSGLVCRSFYLSRAGGASITVYQGRTKVPGDLLSLTCDGGKSYKTLSALPAGTNYIFVEVDENETTLTADHSQTLPVGKNQMVIGVVIVASGAITGIVQWYLSDLPGLGDKRVAVDKAATPDFIGTTAGDGVIRVGSGLTKTDGGDFVTLDLNGSGSHVLPAGGLKNQPLVKNSDSDYDVKWDWMRGADV